MKGGLVNALKVNIHVGPGLWQQHGGRGPRVNYVSVKLKGAGKISECRYLLTQLVHIFVLG